MSGLELNLENDKHENSRHLKDDDPWAVDGPALVTTILRCVWLLLDSCCSVAGDPRDCLSWMQHMAQQVPARRSSKLIVEAVLERIRSVDCVLLCLLCETLLCRTKEEIEEKQKRCEEAEEYLFPNAISTTSGTQLARSQ